MYKTHCKEINEFSLKNKHNFHKTTTFVLLTIQQNLNTIHSFMKDIEETGENSKHLWGFKRRGYLESLEKSKSLLTFTKKNIEDPFKLLTKYSSSIHGLGYAKAGFLVQLVTGKIGCLDSKNIERFNLNPNIFKIDKDRMTKNLKLKKAKKYIELCDDLGGSEYLWDSWCWYTAENSNIWENDFAVSQEHVNCIIN